MKELDVRLAPGAALALVAAAVVAPRGAWLDALALAALGAGLALALAVLLGRWARSRRMVRWRSARDLAVSVAFAGAVVAAVMAAGALSQATALPADVSAAIAAGERIQITGTVIGDPVTLPADPYTGQERAWVRVAVASACAASCESRGAAHATVRVVTGADAAPALGDVVTAQGDASSSSDPRIAATVWDARVLVEGKDSGWSVVKRVRETARDAARGLPDQVRGLTLGMVIGDTSDLPPALEEQLRRAGLTHLTAVSGTHFAIVALAVGAVLRRWVRSRIVRAAALGALMVTLAAVVLPEPSVVRALTMGCAVALGWAWGRPAQALAALSAGVVVVLMVEPALAAAVGFQLSVLAVVGIVVLAPALERTLARWLLGPLARAVAVTGAAWLACWPVLVALQPGLGAYTVPANLIAAPAAVPVTLVGLGATVMGLVWPAAAALMMHVAGAFAWLVVAAATAFSSAPGAWLAWPQGGAGVALAASVSLGIAVAVLMPPLKSVMRLVAAVVALALVGGTQWGAQSSGPVTRDWAVVVCDVGQGDMTMVRVAEHEAVVVDTGPAGGEGAQCLERYGVTSIVLLILSHPHADHDGAVAELAAVATVERAWAPPVAWQEGRDFAVRWLEGEGVTVEQVLAGMEWEEGGVRASVLDGLAPVTTASAAVGVEDSEVNDASLPVWIWANGLSVLTLGDLEIEGQDALVPALGSGVVVDLIKVAHHGSRKQSEALAALITARVAAVSVGEHNSFGHPNDATLALYADRASMVLTTAQCGDIALTPDGAVAARCPPDMAG